MSVIGILFAYGLGMPAFDTTSAVAAGLEPPTVTQYFEAILRYAAKTRFGRRRDDDGHARAAGASSRSLAA